MSSPAPVIGNRDDLIAALRFASVIEHMLACEYLFAGFSVRKTLADFDLGAGQEDENSCRRAQAELDTFRPWLALTYQIARQEMEHLAIVQSLLAALGDEPYLMRPDFPVSSQHTFLGAPFRLDRFSTGTLRRFIWYERPDYLTAEFRRRHGDPGETDLADVEAFFVPEFLRSLGSVQALYEAIALAFGSLDPAELFRGNPARQLPDDTFGYRVDLVPVSNRETAAAAIQLIIEQGEGIGESPRSGDPAHFEIYLSILRELDQAQAGDPAFDPALPVVSNPARRTTYFGLRQVNETRIHRITNPHTLRVMQLFDDAYSLMLVMMQSFFGTYSGIYVPEPRPQAALFYAAFFPMMTMVIRPLGEIVARMPAHGDGLEPAPGQPRAGVTFSINPDVIAWKDLPLRQNPRDQDPAMAPTASGPSGTPPPQSQSQSQSQSQPQPQAPGGVQNSAGARDESPGLRIPVIRTVLDAGYYRNGLEELAASAAARVDDVPVPLRADMSYLHENLTSTAKHLDSIWNSGR